MEVKGIAVNPVISLLILVVWKLLETFKSKHLVNPLWENTIFNPPGWMEAGTWLKINLQDTVTHEEFDYSVNYIQLWNTIAQKYPWCPVFTSDAKPTLWLNVLLAASPFVSDRRYLDISHRSFLQFTSQQNSLSYLKKWYHINVLISSNYRSYFFLAHSAATYVSAPPSKALPCSSLLFCSIQRSYTAIWCRTNSLLSSSWQYTITLTINNEEIHQKRLCI